MVKGLGSGLTSESADAIRVVLLTICRPDPRFVAPTGAAGLICLAWARGRGSQVRRPAGARAIPQSQKGMTLTIVQTRGAPRGVLSYPRRSREELGGEFLGLMAYLDSKDEGDN